MSESVHDKILDYYKTNTLVKHDDALVELLCGEIDKNKQLKAENEKLKACIDETLAILAHINPDTYNNSEAIHMVAKLNLETLNSFSKTIAEKEEE